MNIIDGIFYGHLNIGDESPDERNDKLESELDAVKEKFRSNLTDSQKEELDELIELELRSTVVDMAYFFRRGVQIGFKLAKELKKG